MKIRFCSMKTNECCNFIMHGCSRFFFYNFQLIFLNFQFFFDPILSPRLPVRFRPKKKQQKNKNKRRAHGWKTNWLRFKFGGVSSPRRCLRPSVLEFWNFFLLRSFVVVFFSFFYFYFLVFLRCFYATLLRASGVSAPAFHCDEEKPPWSNNNNSNNNNNNSNSNSNNNNSNNNNSNNKNWCRQQRRWSGRCNWRPEGGGTWLWERNLKK